jgi:NADH dehydrogenase [ubiquinone] 1 alpha subcomplex assembly factor 7
MLIQKPKKAKQKYNQRLLKYLRSTSNTDNILPIDKFINILQYNVYYGYYKNKLAIGKKQDFITSPEISSLFSEIIAISIINQIQSNFEIINRHGNIRLIEFGAGRGTLIGNVISCIEKYPDIFNKLEIVIYETNKFLIRAQKKLLQKYNKKISWKCKSRLHRADFEKQGYFIFLANEFFDCLPIKQYLYTNGYWHEILIKIENTNLSFINSSKKTKVTSYFPKKPKEGDIFEISPVSLKYLNLMLNVIEKDSAFAIIIDYGYFFLPKTSTLQAVKNHKKVGIFDYLAESDISSLVNFLSFVNLIESKYLKNFVIETQREFLLKMGIKIRQNILEKNLNEEQKFNLNLAVNRLIDQSQMGGLFKVLRISSNNQQKIF